MAVQAQHFSNTFSQDLCPRVSNGGILDGLKMMNQSRDHLIGELIHTLDPIALTGDAGRLTDTATGAKSDHLKSDLTCNAPTSRKRSRDGAAINMEAAIYQQLAILNSATSTQMGQGLCPVISVRGSGFPVFESSASSSYEQPAALPCFTPTVLPELLSHYYQHDHEVHAILNNQMEILRLGMEEARKRYCRALLSALGQHALKKLREKEAELANASRRNAELEETARQLSSQGLIWFNLAKKNESIVSILRARLEQALIQSATAAAAPPAIEGYGDSEVSPIAAEDVQSCCYDKVRRIEPSASAAPTSGDRRSLAACKVCRENEVSMLVLPCKHLCLCEACDAGVQTCPVCRFPKTASLKIFMS